MQRYHQTSLYRAQSIRIFPLIHELSQDNSYTINASSVDRFLKSLNLVTQQDLVKFMHSIDRQDKQMRCYYWGYCISWALESSASASELDYASVHRNIKHLMLGIWSRPLQNYEIWDGNAQRSPQQKDQMYAKIIDSWKEISLYIAKIDVMMLTNNISSINYCFSLLTLFPNKKNQIEQLYENILGSSTFVQTLQFMLATNVSLNILIQMLKSLCYLYQALRVEKIRKILEKTFLVEPATLEGLLQNISDGRPQVRYYTCVMMGLMARNVPALPAILLSNKTLLKDLSNGIALTSEKEGLMFGVEFLIGVVKGFGQLSEHEKKENEDIIIKYLQFAVVKLGQLESEKSQATCIRLVLEIVKVMDLSNENLKLLRFIESVFEGQKIPKFQILFELALEMLKYSIINKRTNIEKYIANDKSFECYVKGMLQQGHEDWQPFYSCLQVLLLMAQTPHLCEILFQRDLIKCVLGLSSSPNGTVIFYVSEILLHLILNSFESEWKITYLYQKDCLNTIGMLIARSCSSDIVLEKQYSTMQQISYLNRTVFVNCLKSLHYINLEGGNLSILKKQHYVKYFSQFFIDQFTEGLYYFFSIVNRKYLQMLLRQQHSLSRNPNSQHPPVTKLFKLVTQTIEKMTQNLRNRTAGSVDILKSVNKTRNFFLTNLYACLNYNQLIVESIPIYLIYVAYIEGRVLKQTVYRMTWGEFRSLMWEFIHKAVAVQAEAYRIFHKNSGQEIKHQDDYRIIMEKILMDYNKHNYNFQVEIREIRKKQEVPTFGNTENLRKENEYRNSPRFMSYQMPQARYNSPFSIRRGQSQRGSSPNFGTLCSRCQKMTTNPSRICNSCTDKYEFR